MKYKQIIFLLAAFLCLNASAKDFLVESPDKSLILKVEVGEGISWSVALDGKQLIDSSVVALQLNNEVLGVNPKVAKSAIKRINETSQAIVNYKFSNVIDRCNELLLAFKGKYSLRFRVYDNGIAYRFETARKGGLIVKGEKMEINFAGNCSVFFPEEESFFSHYERLYLDTTLNAISEAQMCSLPALVAAPGGVKIGITETGQSDYPAMFLKGTGGNALTATFPAVPLELKQVGDRKEELVKQAGYIAKTSASRVFPWRCIMIAREDKELIENNIPYILAERNVIKDVSWIKPGKVAWDWWNANNIYGVDFKSGVNTETYKYYIDFAAKYGLEYIILDEGWSNTTRLNEVVPGMDIQELVGYGNSKGVGVILWVLWKPLYENLEEYLDTFAKWGVVGVKVDFMQRADQLMVDYYEGIAAEAAKRKMLVDFHGAFKPNGLQRKYPNVINFEGVFGAEQNKWSYELTPSHNVTLPFTRMLAGPLDYTPGAMRNETAKGFSANFDNPMSQGTRCHQAAMYVIYEAPLQMLCDNPSHYLRDPEYTGFIAKMPTLWDETVALEGKVKEYLIVARRNGNDWYIGGMNDWTARDFEVDLSFLGTGDWAIEYVADGINAGRYPADYILRKGKLGSKKLKISMAPGGGYAAILKKLN
ncbi:Alpha-glucosidase [hydrothermal vent metagenome]|uniref:Alpha-glucosidase n=1 Tax=hydrothermal vent metagenome TaxID=652676 RepID=A0A3B0TPU8_9ZZZZ